MLKTEDVRVTEKLLVTLALVSWYAAGHKIGYSHNTYNLEEHALYILSHANVWHLIGNLFVMWMLKRFPIIPALLIAFFVSFIPTSGTLWCLLGYDTVGVTMGFSGVLFAMLGINWGNQVTFYWQKSSFVGTHVIDNFCKKMLPWALIGFFIPHVNWELHLFSLMTGFLYGLHVIIWPRKKT